MQGIHRRSFIYRIALFALDFIFVILALILSTTLRIELGIGRAAIASAFQPPLILYPIAGFFWVYALYLMKVYVPIYSKPFWQELQRLLFGHIIASFLFFGLLYLLYRDFSRLQAIYLVVLIYVFLLLLRIGVRIYFSWRGFNHNRPYRFLIVGVGSHAQRVSEKLQTLTKQGIQLMGYIQEAPSSMVTIPPSNLIVSSIDKVNEVVNDFHIDEVIIALDNQDSVNLHELVNQLGQTSVTIRLAVDFSELAYFEMSIDAMVGVPLIGLREPIFSPTQKLLKRILDVILSGLGLIILSPLLLLISYAIKRDTKGSIIIQQSRVGQFSKPFTMYKFRSMYADAPNQSYEWLEHKRADDPRITPVGKIIRRWSLDELPQLFNVLRGDMSLVGPRPELPEMVDMYQSWQKKRFEVPQGMTGWWQINGRSDKPMFENTEYDLYYITHYSVWMDIFILIRTISAVISGRGAY